MGLDTIVDRQRPARILLVEDNAGDVILTKRAFKQAKLANELIVANTGEEAVKILNKEGEHANVHNPDIILLDLNLPGMSGEEVLEFVKNNSRFQHIPVMILSSSKAEQDVVKSYNLHANGYIVKPVSLDRFQEIVEKLEAFWFTVVVMPDENCNSQAIAK